MAASHGRNVKSNRGIGGGGKTSTSKPGSMGSGFKKTGGDGIGTKGAGKKVGVPKGKQSKAMKGC